jgi:hypothetical protein
LRFINLYQKKNGVEKQFNSRSIAVILPDGRRLESAGVPPASCVGVRALAHLWEQAKA